MMQINAQILTINNRIKRDWKLSLRRLKLHNVIKELVVCKALSSRRFALLCQASSIYFYTVLKKLMFEKIS